MLLTSSLWGSSFLMMKYALEELDAFNIAFYRIFIGMIFINLIDFKKTSFSLRQHFELSMVGLLWMSFPFYLFAKAEETITSSLAGLINGSTPIFISLVAVLIFKNKNTVLGPMETLTKMHPPFVSSNLAPAQPLLRTSVLLSKDVKRYI